VVGGRRGGEEREEGRTSSLVVVGVCGVALAALHCSGEVDAEDAGGAGGRGEMVEVVVVDLSKGRRRRKEKGTRGEGERDMRRNGFQRERRGEGAGNGVGSRWTQ
jgi:hypothetical protein